MNYIIECRPPRKFVEALSQANLEPLGKLFSNLVLFAREISCADGPGLRDIEPLIQEALSETLKFLPPTIQIEVDRIEVSEGSIIVRIFAIVVMLPHAAGAVAGAGAATVAGPIVGGLAAGYLVGWAADKFLGGALSEFGKVFATKVVEKISGWWKKRGQQPPVMIAVDPEEIAYNEALKVASQHGCKPALTGGLCLAEHFYQYSYQLYGCGRNVLTVTVDLQGKNPPAVTVQ